MKQQRKKEKNIFTETDTRSGKVHTVVSLQWPDGIRFRRRYRNLELAHQILKRIDGAIVTCQWEALRNELTRKKGKPEAPKPEVITFGRLAGGVQVVYHRPKVRVRLAEDSTSASGRYDGILRSGYAHQGNNAP